jgi:hypothetical protein
VSFPADPSAFLLAVTLGDALGDLGLAILVAVAGSVALTLSIGLAMRGGAGFVDLDREGRFPAAILSLGAAGLFALVALGVVVALVLLLVRG